MQVSQLNQAVVVTGASTGIGRAAVIELARAGFVTYAGVRKQADADAISAEAATLSLADRLLPLMIDVVDPASIAAAAQQLVERHPEGLAGLVNNAGVVFSGPVEALPLDQWRRQYEVNVFGVIAVTQAFLPQLRRAKGRVVNVSSIGGRHSLPFVGAYTSSKFAIEAITDSLRMELSPLGVKVVAVEPGAIRTAIFGKAQNQVAELRSGLNDEQKAVYGPSIDRAVAAWEKIESKGIAPAVAGRVIVKAMTQSSPRSRYLVGTDARLQAVLKSWLPDFWLDAITRRLMGLGAA